MKSFTLIRQPGLPPLKNRTLLAFCLTAGILSLLLTGCHRFQIPAIDPTGNRIFASGQSTSILSPQSSQRSGGLLSRLHQGKSNQPSFDQAFQPAPLSSNPFSSAPLPAGPSPVPSATTPLLGGLQPTQPAFQHPPDPQPCDQKGHFQHAGFQRSKHLIPKPTGAKTAGQKGELLMSPSKIIAPVGSEVVVLAGICGSDGYFVKNQPLEWMLSNDSVGQIIEVGGMQHAAFNKIVPPTAEKRSGQYAKGRTGLKNVVLTRGTPTPCDDIELREGQTYISVMSASSGTSYITGYAPQAEGWDRRIASTIIHWVDGVWAIPVPSTATVGTVQPLTTLVSQTSGAGGIEGWKVRYAIVGGAAAEFVPTASQTAEAVTGKDGQATVQIRQQAGNLDPGATQIRVDVIRPQLFGQPELVVESGITTVTWSAPALTIRAIGPRTAGVDESFNYRIEVSNPGDQVARDVMVRTKDLDDALEYISATPKPTEFGKQLEWQLGEVQPGAPPKIVDVQFKTSKRGNVGLCFEVVSATERLATEACTQTEIRLPCIGFTIDGPNFARVNDSLTFRMNIQNQCDEPLNNLRLRFRHDEGLLHPGFSNPETFQLERLQINDSTSLPITLLAQSTGLRCFDVEVTADGGHSATARWCVEVGEQALEQIRDQIGLEVVGGSEMTVGETSLVTIRVTNRGNVALDGVLLTNRFAASIVAVDMTQGLQFSWAPDEREGNEQLFVSIGRLQAAETREIVIRYQGLNVDAAARNEFAITSTLGAAASDRITMRVNPVGRDQIPDDRGIGIPQDRPRDQPPGQNPDPLSVSVRSDQNGIQLQNSVNPDPTLPRQAVVEMVIKNNSDQPLRFVDITLEMTPSLRLLEFDYGTTNLEITNRNEDFTQFYIRRVNELRPGEELRFMGRVVGVQPTDNAAFSVRASSLDAPAVRQGTPLRIFP